MTDPTIEKVLDAPFTFTARPRPISCELRPVWRLHVLMLLLDQCWGAQASLEQLHVLNWAARTPDTRNAFLDFLFGKRTPSQIVVRYDPSLNRAVHFAFAEGLIRRREVQQSLNEHVNVGSPPYRIIMANKGRELLKHIGETDDCFVEIKRFLDSIPQKVTQKQIEMLFTWGNES